MSEKRVAFVHRGGKMMASYRYRAEIPMAQLGGINGYTAKINEGAADILVFSKPVADDVELAKNARAQGCKIVADIGDNHFERAPWNAIYGDMIATADFIVCPTPVMADIIHGHTGRTVDAIIPDPYEEPLCAPHAAEATKLLWFGHHVNLNDILPWLQMFKGQDLKILTGPNNAIKHYEQWSQAAQTRALSESHIVVLPTRKGAEYKSANRIVNALRAGCFPVVGLHPAHKEFRKFAWVGHVHTGVRWAQHFKSELNGLVAEGQQYVEKFSPEVIGCQWAQVVEAL